MSNSVSVFSMQGARAFLKMRQKQRSGFSKPQTRAMRRLRRLLGQCSNTGKESHRTKHRPLHGIERQRSVAARYYVHVTETHVAAGFGKFVEYQTHNVAVGLKAAFLQASEAVQ